MSNPIKNKKIKNALKDSKLLKDDLLIIIRACELKGNANVKKDELINRIIEGGEEEIVRKHLTFWGFLEEKPSKTFSLFSRKKITKANYIASPNSSINYSLKAALICSILSMIIAGLLQPDLTGYLLNWMVCVDNKSDNGADITFNAINNNFKSVEPGDIYYRQFLQSLATNPTWFNREDNFVNERYKQFCFCDKVDNQASKEKYNRGDHILRFTGAYVLKENFRTDKFFEMEGANVIFENGKIKELTTFKNEVSESSWVNAAYRYKWLVSACLLFLGLFGFIHFPMVRKALLSFSGA